LTFAFEGAFDFATVEPVSAMGDYGRGDAAFGKGETGLNRPVSPDR
jgi:hypothetical protein